MFVGHLAVALGAKRVAPRVSLGWLVGAAFGLDLLWPLFLLLGVERVVIEPGNTAFTPLHFESYPWSHSLVMVCVWAALLGWVAQRRVQQTGTAWVIGAVVISHWILDWITHRPDLPLWPAGPVAGLGLWQSVGGTLAVEGGMLAIGVLLYTAGTRAKDAIGTWALVGLLGLTGVIWVSGPWSPPPPSATAIAMVGLAMWLFPVWAAWIDRHRDEASSQPR